jgi:hypothetical protein
MAKDRDLEGTPISGTAAPPAETQVRIRWDDSNMRSSYANVCNVTGTREEIVLLFGMNQAWRAGQKELTVKLSDRIILSPFAAKRLATLLNNVIRDYEFRFGPLDMEARRKYDSTMH